KLGSVLVLVLVLVLTSGIRPCSGQTRESPREALAALERLGGFVSRDFQAFEVIEPDSSGVAFVDLGSAKVGDSDLAHLGALGPVYGLSLMGTNVTDAGLEHLASLGTLQRLVLDRTRITDASLAHVAKLRNLRLLSLAHTKITDAGLRHLKDLSK